MFRKESGVLSVDCRDRRKCGDGRGTRNARAGFLSCLLACCCLLFTSVSAADSLWTKGVVAGTEMRYPADFNVFSFGDIEGVTDWNTFQDVEGPLAAGGSLTLKGFTLNYDDLSDHPAGAVVGGDVTFDWGGTVFGDLFYGGVYTAPEDQITYKPQPLRLVAGPVRGVPIDFNQARADLAYYSDLLSDLAPNSAAERDEYGAVHFDCSGDGPTRVFEVDAAVLDEPSEIWFDNLPPDRNDHPIILINVKGSGGEYEAVDLYNSNILATDTSLDSTKILWNFSGLTNVYVISTGFVGSLLAPRAEVWLRWNSFEGTLVADRVSGSAELYHSPFQGYEALQDKILEEGILPEVVHVESRHLASEYKEDAPGTVGIVTWSVDETKIPTIDSAVIRFGLTPSFGMEAPVDLTEPDYRTLLLGMKPDRLYYFQVVVTSGEQTYAGTIETIRTGSAPNFVTVYLDNYDRDARNPGFIVSSIWDNGNPLAFILDEDGDIVWWFRSDVGALSRATMSYDAKSMWLMPDGGPTVPLSVQVVSMDTLETEIFDVGASHDITPVDEDTIAYIDYGEADCNSVFTMDKEGNTTEIFETQSLEGTYNETLWKNGEVYAPPFCHLNALHYYPDMDIYSVSDRQLSIIVFKASGDPENPEIIMRLDQVTGVDYNPYNDWNHGHQLLSVEPGNGQVFDTILFFANDLAEPGDPTRSAAVEYLLSQVSEDHWEAEETFRYEASDAKSKFFGDVQRLPNGNTLVTYSVSKIIREVDPEGGLVMNITVSGVSALGYAMWRPTLYGPPPY